MKITTEKFGDIEFEESAVITFTEGVLGFADDKRYILMNADESSPFKWLQSIDNTSLAFLLIDPNVFKSDYNANVPDEVKGELEISEKDDYVVFVIVVVRSDPNQSTANLLGPIILNVKSRRAKQIVLNNPEYTTRYRLMGG
jgi:flagellar assembly factor FliW